MDKDNKQGVMEFLKRFGILIIFAVLCAYGIFALISQQQAIDKANERNKALTEQLAQSENEKKDLQQELTKAGSDEYAKDTARDKLGWVKDNEIVFRSDDNGEKNENH